MTESKLYTCEYCNTSYKDKNRCEECESNHKTPIQFVKSYYLPYKNMKTGYPNRINIVFNDGNEVIYLKG